MSHANHSAAALPIWNFVAPASTPDVRDVPGTWHSQSFQDRLVMEILNHQRDGFFIDLAANDPFLFSNTRAIERDYGWRGLCIEGQAELARKLAQHRTCQVVNNLIGAHPGSVVFEEVRAFDGWEHGLSHVVGKGDLSKSIPNQNNSFSVKEIIRIDTIMRAAGAPATINYMSLDVEGKEEAALSSFDFKHHQIEVLTVERPSANLARKLTGHGYAYICDTAAYGDELWVHGQRQAAAQRFRSTDKQLLHGHLKATPSQHRSRDHAWCMHLDNWTERNTIHS